MAVQREKERMSNLEWSRGRKKMIEEQANAELEALHLLHPDRFEYLKLELKSFIQLLQSQSQSQSEEDFHQPNTVQASLVPDSQESSSCRKRRKIEGGGKNEAYGNGLQREEIDESETGEKIGRRRNRVDVVLERAVGCLRKIRRFKTALFSTAD